MDNQPTTRTDTQTNVSQTSKFKLSNMATYLLSLVSDTEQRGETTVVSEIPDEANDALGELLQYKLLQLQGDGVLTVTSSGQNALGKGVALVYPMVPMGTASSYNKTLLSMTENARNALFKAITATWPSIGSSLDKRTLGAFVEMLMNTGTFHRVPAAVNKELHESLKDSVTYYAGKEQNIRDEIAIYAEQSNYWKAQISTKIRSMVEEQEEISLSNAVKLRTSSIEKVSRSETGTVVFHLRDDFTGEITQFPESMIDLTVDQLSQIAEQG